MLYLIGQDIKSNARSKGVTYNGHAPFERWIPLTEELVQAIHLTHHLIDDGLGPGEGTGHAWETQEQEE